jgi:amidase
LLTGIGDELDLLDIEEIHIRLVYGELSSAEFVQRCLDRIAGYDKQLGAVIAVDPTAMQQAVQSDRRHADGDDLGPLDGIPVLVKDSIDTAGLSSTAGSRLLSRDTGPERDADVVARLRAGGAVILGKTNLSEWSNFRSAGATEGWSAVGGQTYNPYRTGYSPSGSSAGSATAVAAGMAPLALGAETDGSIVGPAGICGIVGVKPEFGLLSLCGVAGISAAMDCVGPLASRVRDAAVCLAVLAGQPGLAGLTAPVAPVRVGVWLPPGVPGDVMAMLAAISGPGLVIVDVELEVPQELLADGMFAMHAEFRPSIEEYLLGRAAGPVSLAEVIAGNKADPGELALFGQDLLEMAASLPVLPAPAALAARKRSRSEARALLADVLERHDVQALIAPSNEPAWPVDYARGDAGRLSSSTLAALAGYPNVSVPAGLVDGLPVGVSVFGPKNLSKLLPLALVIERACGPRPWPALYWPAL